MLEIRLPLSEIIVHIQTGNTTLFCFTFKLRDVASHGYGVLDKFFTLMEFQVVDHVDQKERDGTFVKYAIIVHGIAGKWQDHPLHRLIPAWPPLDKTQGP